MNKNVYIVIGENDYENSDVIKCFNDNKLADDYIKNISILTKQHYNNIYIVECECEGGDK